MRKVIVVSQGGVIQSVLADPGIEVAVVDWDETDEENQGEEYVASFSLPDGPIESAGEELRALFAEELPR